MNPLRWKLENQIYSTSPFYLAPALASFLGWNTLAPIRAPAGYGSPDGVS